MTATGLATSPAILFSYGGGNSTVYPFGNVVADANGDVFGTTQSGDASGDGTVFELSNTASGYVMTTVLTFDSAAGIPQLALVDAKGDSFRHDHVGRRQRGRLGLRDRAYDNRLRNDARHAL